MILIPNELCFALSQTPLSAVNVIQKLDVNSANIARSVVRLHCCEEQELLINQHSAACDARFGIKYLNTSEISSRNLINNCY